MRRISLVNLAIRSVSAASACLIGIAASADPLDGQGIPSPSIPNTIEALDIGLDRLREAAHGSPSRVVTATVEHTEPAAPIAGDQAAPEPAVAPSAATDPVPSVSIQADPAVPTPAATVPPDPVAPAPVATDPAPAVPIAPGPVAAAPALSDQPATDPVTFPPADVVNPLQPGALSDAPPDVESPTPVDPTLPGQLAQTDPPVIPDDACNVEAVQFLQQFAELSPRAEEIKTQVAEIDEFVDKTNELITNLMNRAMEASIESLQGDTDSGGRGSDTGSDALRCDDDLVGEIQANIQFLEDSDFRQIYEESWFIFWCAAPIIDSVRESAESETNRSMRSLLGVQVNRLLQAQRYSDAMVRDTGAILRHQSIVLLRALHGFDETCRSMEAM
ncbi:MAG: hypothetical protein H6842_11135 [Rhodospirillaceae bacterium]|nr:hypothetical protein [Rhodospirillaceae bacterium]